MLYIAEKSSAGETIFFSLTGKKPSPGNRIENGRALKLDNGDVISWAAGHLIEVDDSFAKGRWEFEKLPIIPRDSQWRFKPSKIEHFFKQLKVLQKLLKEHDCVINCGDAEREGQLIVDEILDFVNYKGKVERAWINEMVPEKIVKAIKERKPNEHYRGFKESAEARRRADWVFGINLTMLYTLLYGGGQLMTLGRVQTPTLKMVVDRDLLIENFVPHDFYELEATFNLKNKAGSYKGMWLYERSDKSFKQDDKGRCLDKTFAESLKKSLEGKEGDIVLFKKSKKKAFAPSPFNTTDAVAEISKKINVSVKQASEILQVLYEKGLITYPRTDCIYIEEERFGDAPQIISSLSGVFPWLSGYKKTKLVKSKYFNTSKVEAHSAIVPTGLSPNGKGLTHIHIKALEMIATRWMMNLLPPKEYFDTTIETKVEDEFFRTKGFQIIQKGWSELEASNRNDVILPDVSEHDKVNAVSVDMKSGKTTPPPRFTEDTLLRAMENISRYMEDDSLKSRLKERGIGTGATRAPTIEKLLERKFLVKKGRFVISSDIGRKIILAEKDAEFLKPEVTAIWEEKLEEVLKSPELGQMFVSEIEDYVSKIIEDRKNVKPEPNRGKHGKSQDLKAIGKCPLCGGDVVVGKKGYGCSNWREEDGGCRFVIWNTIAKKKISEATAKKLLGGKEVSLKGFTSKAGKKFDAILYLDDDKKVKFKFK